MSDPNDEKDENKENDEKDENGDPTHPTDAFDQLQAAETDDQVGDPFAELDTDPETPFESMETEPLETDIWETIGSDEPPSESTPSTHHDPVETVVEKRRYCQRCPHFGEPPDAVCTHPGTTILEVVDSERFRVQNCPVVARQADDEAEPTFDRDIDG